MAIILRLLRFILPLFVFFLLGKILKSFFAVYVYQKNHGGQYGGFGYDGRDRSGRTSQNGGFRRGPSPDADPYVVLGCNRSSSTDEIKKRYRELIAKYHPDRFVGMSLDDEFVKLASDKFQEIQSAYESIRKDRGF